MSTSATTSAGHRVRLAGRLALTAASMTVGLIAYGAWVRASGSGLGCPDWPLCEGAVVPGLEGDTAVEFGHRIFAGLTMLMTLAAATVAWRARAADPRLALVLGGALFVIIAQAGLGGLTVLTELDGNVRLAHLIFAMTTLGLLTAGAVRALDVTPSPQPGIVAASMLLGVGVLGVLAGGSIVGSGISAGCPGLPFCDERSALSVAIQHDAHRVLGALLFAGLIAAAIRMTRAKRQRRPRATRLGAMLHHGALALMLVQGYVGVALVTTTTSAEHLRVMHLGLATLVMWALVTSWLLALKVPQP